MTTTTDFEQRLATGLAALVDEAEIPSGNDLILTGNQPVGIRRPLLVAACVLALAGTAWMTLRPTDSVIEIAASPAATTATQPSATEVSLPEEIVPFDVIPIANSDAADKGISLVQVGEFVVNESIGDQLAAMLAAAKADGLDLVGGGYRSTASQIELRKAHCGTSDYAIYDMPASLCKPPTARPGVSSHEYGLAVDFDHCRSRETACYRWLAAHASDYGFQTLPGEPWHWSTIDEPLEFD